MGVGKGTATTSSAPTSFIGRVLVPDRSTYTLPAAAQRLRSATVRLPKVHRGRVGPFHPPEFRRDEDRQDQRFARRSRLEWSGASDGAELTLPFMSPHRGPTDDVLIARQSNGGLGRFFIDSKPVSQTISFYEDGYDMHIEIL